jgi:hypothetical protein
LVGGGGGVVGRAMSHSTGCRCAQGMANPAHQPLLPCARRHAHDALALA